MSKGRKLLRFMALGVGIVVNRLEEEAKFGLAEGILNASISGF